MRATPDYSLAAGFEPAPPHIAALYQMNPCPAPPAGCWLLLIDVSRREQNTLAGEQTETDFYGAPPLSYRDLHPEQESNPRPPFGEVTVPYATGQGGFYGAPKSNARKLSDRGTSGDRTLADVLPWTTRTAIAAGFEPAFSAPEVSVAYATGQGGFYGARATATPEKKFGRGTSGCGIFPLLCH